MPFLGSAGEAAEALAALAALRLRDDDEVIVADNGGRGAVEAAAAGGSGLGRLRVIAADAERSAYYTRNVAVEASSSEWILFVDADCRPAPTLADDYFDPPPGEATGALAGPIEPAAQTEAIARWAASREVLSQERSLRDLPGGPAAATANMLVRRRAFEEVGGFLEGLSLGTEFEFCWRLADAK